VRRVFTWRCSLTGHRTADVTVLLVETSESLPDELLTHVTQAGIWQGCHDGLESFAIGR